MTYKQQYMKERKRIQQNVARMKKRGYEFAETPLPPIPKRITKASINRLKKITPKKLYEKATYTSATGEKVSGKKGVQIERKKRAQKAQATKAQKEQAKRDYARKEFFKDYKEKIEPTITSGEIAVQNLERIIQDAYAIGNNNSAQLIEKILQDEIATKETILIKDGYVGDAHQQARNIVGFAMENAPEKIVDIANVVFHYKMHTGTWQRAYTTLINIITGTIPTAEQQNYYQDIMQKDVEWVDDE